MNPSPLTLRSTPCLMAFTICCLGCGAPKAPDPKATTSTIPEAKNSKSANPTGSSPTLLEARRGFKTRITPRGLPNEPIPAPPPELFQLIPFDSEVGALEALLSPDPKDGKKHPAIIWITGGDCNSIDAGVWNKVDPTVDQTTLAAESFRRAGLVIMFPTLRGGNDNPGQREGLFGEVNDVLSATEFLSKQPYVDPNRIYLAGHSTGGTLALLVAASSDRYRGIFAFGPADVPTDHSREFLPFPTSNRQEIDLRSPIRWLQSIRNPTFVFEGVYFGNISALTAMKQASTNNQLHFFPVKGANHVTVVGPVSKLLADKISRDDGEKTNLSITEEELVKAFSK